MSLFGWVLLVAGTCALLLMNAWLGPLDEAAAPDAEAAGHLTDGGVVWPLRTGRMIIGRGPDADIDLDSVGVGWVHAELLIGESARLTDLGTRRGTLVNGRRLQRPAALADGDVVTIGARGLVYRSAPPARDFLDVDGVLHPIGARLLIGRGADNDIDLIDRSASRAHAEIVRHGDQLIVSDLWSAHGTQLNGRRVRGPEPLADGDALLIGATTLTFRAADTDRSDHRPQQRTIQV